MFGELWCSEINQVGFRCEFNQQGFFKKVLRKTLLFCIDGLVKLIRLAASSTQWRVPFQHPWSLNSPCSKWPISSVQSCQVHQRRPRLDDGRSQADPLNCWSIRKEQQATGQCVDTWCLISQQKSTNKRQEVVPFMVKEVALDISSVGRSVGRSRRRRLKRFHSETESENPSSSLGWWTSSFLLW